VTTSIGAHCATRAGNLHPPAASSAGGLISAMSMFKVNVTARNPKREELVTQPLEALVDTGSELT